MAADTLGAGVATSSRRFENIRKASYFTQDNDIDDSSPTLVHRNNYINTIYSVFLKWSSKTQNVENEFDPGHWYQKSID